MWDTDDTSKLLTGGLPGYAAGEIFASLREYAHRTRRGCALPAHVGFSVELAHRRTFCPDAAYFLGEVAMSFPVGAPAFAVKVRSERSYGPAAEEAAARLRQDYFKAGTLVVWDVDLLSQEPVRVFRSGKHNEPVVYRWGQVAEAEPAVPGWTLPVDNLLP